MYSEIASPLSQGSQWVSLLFHFPDTWPSGGTPTKAARRSIDTTRRIFFPQFNQAESAAKQELKIVPILIKHRRDGAVSNPASCSLFTSTTQGSSSQTKKQPTAECRGAFTTHKMSGANTSDRGSYTFAAEAIKDKPLYHTWWWSTREQERKSPKRRE